MSRSVTTVTAPAESPVSVAELKLHMRLSGDDGSHDVFIANLIATATTMFERETGCALVRRTLALHLDQFPAATKDNPSAAIYLPKPPALQVNSVKYLDTDSVQQTLDPSVYQADVDHVPARVALKPDQNWPETKRMLGAVSIEFVAGYGDPDEGKAEDVPQDAKAAIKMLAAHLYDNPKAASELKLEAVPMAVSTIIDQYKMPVL